MSEHNAFRAYLAEHPKMIGAVFTLLLLLNEAGRVIAGPGAGNAGT